MMSRFTGGGFDINSLLVVKKSAAALTRRKRTLSLVFTDDRDGPGRFLLGSSAYAARAWIKSGVSNTSEISYTSSQNSVGCCCCVGQLMKMAATKGRMTYNRYPANTQFVSLLRVEVLKQEPVI